MRTRTEVVFRDMAPSPSIETRMQDYAETIRRFVADMTGLRAMIGQSTADGRRGCVYAVRLEIRLPDAVLTIDRPSDAGSGHETPYAALHDAFARLERRLRRWGSDGEAEPPSGRARVPESFAVVG